MPYDHVNKFLLINVHLGIVSIIQIRTILITQMFGMHSDIGQLTWFRWCRRRCSPPHTAPGTGTHVAPVEQSVPVKSENRHVSI